MVSFQFLAVMYLTASAASAHTLSKRARSVARVVADDLDRTKEIPPATMNCGTPCSTGDAEVTYDIKGDELCFKVNAYGIDAVSAIHLHRAGFMESNTATFNLGPPAGLTLATQDVMAPKAKADSPLIEKQNFTACIGNVSKLPDIKVEMSTATVKVVDYLDALFDAPHKYYFNLHTPSEPNGCLRDQLSYA